MKKTIYNKILTKILISILVVMILMSNIQPCVVWAKKYEGSYTYKEWKDKYGKDSMCKYAIENAALSYLSDTWNGPGLLNNITGDEERWKAAKDILKNYPNDIIFTGTFDEGMKGLDILYWDGYTFDPSFKITSMGYSKKFYESYYSKEIGYVDFKNKYADGNDTTAKDILGKRFAELYQMDDKTYVGGNDPIELARKVIELYKDKLEIRVLGEDKNKYTILMIRIKGDKKGEYLAEEVFLVEAGKALGWETNDGKTVAGNIQLTNEHGTYKGYGTIQGVLTCALTVYTDEGVATRPDDVHTDTDSKKFVSIGTLMGRGLTAEEKENYINTIKAEIIEYTKTINYNSIELGYDEIAQQIMNYYKDSSKITVTVGGSYNESTPGQGASFEVLDVQITLTKQDFDNAINSGASEGLNTEVKVVDKYGHQYDEETDESGQLTDTELASPDDNPSLLAKAGGLLLEPIFSLVNFVADAIVGTLGSIMEGRGLTMHPIMVNGESGPRPGKSYQVVEMKETDFDNTEWLAWLGIGEIQLPNITYTPEEIFAGEKSILSIDFISGKNSDGVEIGGDWASIRAVVSQWYQVLRMIAIIGLLSVLIYTGIKIIISANAKDKAKYKEWIINWFMAVAILFSMHFIMAFIISVTGEFSKLLSNASQGILIKFGEKQSATNLMGLVRFMVQADDLSLKIGYEVMYIALIVYTIKFTIVYLKRVLNMAFLTLIAPIVALTYPIDKLNDGRAQGFDMWLKEYIFNALLQPMHQIMYYILVGSAIKITASNPIYGIVVLMFMTEAEKLLKKIFGFDKASGGTVGGMAGAFAAGAIASNIKNLARLGKGAGGKGGSNAEKLAGGDPKPTQGLDMEAFGAGAGVGAGAAAALSAGDNSDENNTNEKDETNAQIEGQDDLNKAENDFYAQKREELLDMGISEEDVDKEMMDTYGATGRTTPEPPNTKGNQNKNENNNKNATPIRDMAKRFGKGSLAVGKRLAKPVWDFNHGAAYNGKRLLRNTGRIALGAGLGITAAAVQAGISITDGKYNPAEGFASFAAGYAGGGQIAKGIGSLANTYTEGALEGDKQAAMKRAQKQWADREDVIKFNRANYKPEEIKEITKAQSEYLLPYGFDLKEMKSVTKYAQKLKEGGVSEAEAYKQAANTLKFSQNLTKQNQGNIAYNDEKRNKYIASMVEGKSGEEKAKLEKAYKNAFNSLIAYNEANK